MMALAAAASRHPDELRADLQRVYGIDIDHARAGEHTAWHIAALVSCLPRGSMLARAEDPDAEWTTELVLLADLCNQLSGLIWGMSTPSERGDRRRPVGPSWMTEAAGRALPIDELMEELGKPRRGSPYGG